MKTGMRLLKVAAIGLLLGGMADTAFAGNTLTQLLGNMPGRVHGAKLLGKHNPDAMLDITVAMRLQNTSQLPAFLRQLQDPHSPNYHHFLGVQEFTDTYGPTRGQVSAMESFLTSNGIRISDVTPDRLLVHASASTATLQRAFHVAVNDYSDKNGSFFSASGDPSLPSVLGAAVVAVMGLDDAVTLTEHLRAPVATPATANTSPHLGPGGFSPQQIATAYGWPSLTDTSLASSTTIAIATAYNFNMSDIKYFWNQYGLPSHSVTLIPVDGTTRRLNDETTLDIERSSAMSPGSTILVYSGATPGFQTFVDVFDKIYTDDKAQVVSTSWGSAESTSVTSLNTEVAEDQAFIELIAKGVTVLAAAGDNGASDGASGTDNADFPSSDPYVVAAGGTHLVLNPNGTYNSEKAWDNPAGGATGGADSVMFAEPSYETNSANWTTNNSNTKCSATLNGAGQFVTDGCPSAGAPSRQSSDMSMDADPATGMSLYYNGRWAVFGGTSFVAPELAGFFAIAVTQHGGPVGEGPSLIFCAANGPNYGTDFNDINTGSNGPSHVFDAGTGWDHPTGWGTPQNGASLINDLIGCIPP